MELEFDLIKIIGIWIDQYGEDCKSKQYGTNYKAIPRTGRGQLLRHLVQTIKDRGKTEEYFRPTVMDIIAKSCFAPEVIPHDRARRRGGYEVTKTELRTAINNIYNLKVSTAPPATISVPSLPFTGQPIQENYDPDKQGPMAPPLDRSTLPVDPDPTISIDADAAAFLGYTSDE